MTPNVPLPLAFGRFKQLPQRMGEVWQGGLVRLPAWVDHPTDPEGEAFRPTGALWVSLRTGLIHLALPPQGSTVTPEFALSALLEFGLKYSKGLEGRPARIEVRDPALRDALADSLAQTGSNVRWLNRADAHAAAPARSGGWPRLDRVPFSSDAARGRTEQRSHRKVDRGSVIRVDGCPERGSRSRGRAWSLRPASTNGNSIRATSRSRLQ